VPRTGAFGISDPNKEYYLDIGDDEDALRAWIDKAHEVSRAIEARGLGFAQVTGVGKRLSNDPARAWFSALDSARDIHEERAIERALAEWADGDAIAAHIAYGLDVFCSADVGNSNAANSILDPTNRKWLTDTFGVKFMTFDELLSSLP
jgi:hypothetical protein